MAEKLGTAVITVFDHDPSSTSHSVLHQFSRLITRPTHYIPDLILPVLKSTAVLPTQAEHGLVSLSAPQIGSLCSAFVIHKYLQPNQWTHYPSSTPEDYEAFLSPIIESQSDEYTTEWEECPSLPGIQGLVTRPNRIYAEYYTEDIQEEEVEITGFKARVLQHELDHLHGLTLLHAFTSGWRLKLKDKKCKEFEEMVEEFREIVLAAAKLDMLTTQGSLGENIQEKDLQKAIRNTFIPERHSKMMTSVVNTLRKSLGISPKSIVE